MNIKQRIQELSLDQKAKLYFMGLVRQGKIDRLPEDPKAAYIKDMMGKMDTIQKKCPFFWFGKALSNTTSLYKILY